MDKAKLLNVKHEMEEFMTRSVAFWLDNGV